MSGRSEPVVAATGGRTSSLEGRTVGGGRFHVRAELGRGGMGEVYRAFDRLRKREVALKVIAARYMGRPERERRFRNEAEYGRRVGEHPHLLSIVDFGALSDCGGRLFMTMDVVHGPTLAMELASSRRIPLDRAIPWARQIADGLKAIHAAGLVHRDLTPSNVLIQAGTDIAKIFDFGLAGELDVPASAHANRLTLLGEVPGTHGYMAPEQAALAPPATAMDVYAFGVVLTEMVVGHNPFAHLDRNEYIEWQQTSHDEAPSIKRWGLALPDGLADLIDDCLRRDPAERPQSGAELMARLDRIVPAPVLLFVPRPTPVMPPEDDGEVDHTTTIKSETIQPRPARPWLVMALVAALLVVMGGVVGWWVAQSDRDASKRPMQEETVPAPAPAVLEVSPTVPTPGASAPAPSRSVPAEPPLVDEPATKQASDEAAVTESGMPQTSAAGSASMQAPASTAGSCETRRDRAHDAAKRKLWKKVLAATDNGRCWPDETERRRLRVRALAETGQHAACVRLAADSSDVEIVRWRVQCEQALWRPAP